MLSLFLPRSFCSWFFLASATKVFSSTLISRDASSDPAPIVFSADQNWDGLDGSWYSFTLRVGTPAQTVRVMPSWMSYQTWVVAPQGCESYLDYSNCSLSRGGIFNSTQSTSWQEIGIYLLWIERNLGYSGNAGYGYDSVGLGELGVDGPTLNSTVGALAVADFWLGIFGLSPLPTNWTDSDTAPSYMTLLKEHNLIPSISFGYTAGAKYRDTQVVGSLTLGGYDESRFEANQVEFDFAENTAGDTVVAIQSITTQAQDSSSNVELLPTTILALIDSTVSQIWLPLEACQAFELEFGLVYDNWTDLYLVNSSLHDELLARDATVKFTLSRYISSGPNVTISLPYSAFDLTAQSPYRGLANDTSYFPLRRASNDTQYTLGRTFMQEAYITVDYERAKFNVSQCSWTQGVSSSIVKISPPSVKDDSGYSGTSPGATDTSTGSSSSHLNGSDIGGIVSGIIVGVCALIAIFTWFIRYERRKKEQSAEAEKGEGAGPSCRDSTASISHTLVGVGEKGTKVFPKAELEGSSVHGEVKEYFGPESSVASPTVRGYSTYSSNDGGPLSPTSEAGGKEVFEMPGDMPEVAQADSKQISEKDLMRRREEIYNGVPSHPGTPTIPEMPGTERRLVQPEDVTLQNEIREETSETTEQSRFSFE